jgi:hypothetical protein
MFGENIENILPCIIGFISICLSLIIGRDFHNSRINFEKINGIKFYTKEMKYKSTITIFPHIVSVETILV